MVEDVVLPAGVEFRHDVVEQRNGLFSGQRPDDEPFGHLEAQRAGALLALGAERLCRQPVEFDDEVVPMGADGRKARKCVFAAMHLQQLRQFFLDDRRVFRRKGVCLFPGAGRVFDGDLFPSAGNAAVELLQERSEFIEVFHTLGNDVRPEAAEPVVPDVQRVIELRMVDGIFQKLVALLHGPVELGQCLGVVRFQLTERLVQELPPLGRTAFDEVQMLRREDDSEEFSDEFRRRSVGQTAQRSRFLVGNENICRHVPNVVVERHGQFCGLCIEPSELTLLRPAERPQPCEQPDGLQQVRLPLGIFAENDIHTRGRLKFDFFYISVVRNIKRLNDHKSLKRNIFPLTSRFSV